MARTYKALALLLTYPTPELRALGPDALAAIDCEVEEFVERHSHAIVIGTVRALEVRPGPPLIYGQGQYGSLAPT